MPEVPERPREHDGCPWVRADEKHGPPLPCRRTGLVCLSLRASEER